MKIGILTYHRAKNYGAFLQAYGLCNSLNAIPNIDAEIIDFHMQKETLHYRPSRGMFSSIDHLKSLPSVIYKHRLFKVIGESSRQLNLSNQYMQSDSLEDFRKFVYGKYDVIIAGSDEIWNMRSYRGFPTPYWLPGDLGCKKVSYAASSRNNLVDLTEQEISGAKKLLEEFNIITVRDRMTLDLLENGLCLNKKIHIMPDPSLVGNYPVDANRGRMNLVNKFHLDPDRKIGLVMTENQKLANQLKKEIGTEYQLIAVYEWQRRIRNISSLTPFEWLDAIAGVDYVFASYFHAICFAIKYGTSFLAFGTPIKKDKLIDVLEGSGNRNRYVEIDSHLFEDGRIKDLTNKGMAPVNNENYLSECQKQWGSFVCTLEKSEIILNEPLHSLS